jgi:hypothetical protein
MQTRQKVEPGDGENVCRLAIARRLQFYDTGRYQAEDMFRSHVTVCLPPLKGSGRKRLPGLSARI